MPEPALPKSPHTIPDEKTISEVYNLPVLSHDGNATSFGELVAPKDGVNTAIAIFSKILPSSSKTCVSPNNFEKKKKV
jgi:hypothetical protein